MIDADFAADQIVANLRAMRCDAMKAREILNLCEAKIEKGDLEKQPELLRVVVN